MGLVTQSSGYWSPIWASAKVYKSVKHTSLLLTSVDYTKKGFCNIWPWGEKGKWTEGETLLREGLNKPAYFWNPWRWGVRSFCQLVSLYTRHFANFKICQFDIMSICYFIYFSFSQRVTLCSSHLVNFKICQWAIMPSSHFIYLSFCQLVTSSTSFCQLQNLSVCHNVK